MKTKLSLVIISIVMMFTLSGCNKINENLIKSDSTFALGTIVKVTIYGQEAKEQDFDEIFQLIRDIENKISKNIKTSEVVNVNNNAGIGKVTVSDSTLYIINKALDFGNISNGKFDITIGPLVDLWGIGTEEAKVPSTDEINNAIALINYEDIEINKNNVKLLNKDMELDLGAIAKGYIADEVSNYLYENGFKHAIINLGGNILTVGNKPNGDKWKIGIQNPYDVRGKDIGFVEIGEKSVVTSGIYERYFEEDGVRYHHILDPHTGFPVENNIAGVSIISDKSIDGDGLSTTVFSLGLEKGIELVESLSGVEAIFITKDHEVYITGSNKGFFKLTNSDFKLK